MENNSKESGKCLKNKDSTWVGLGPTKNFKKKTKGADVGNPPEKFALSVGPGQHNKKNL